MQLDDTGIFALATWVKVAPSCPLPSLTARPDFTRCPQRPPVALPATHGESQHLHAKGGTAHGAVLVDRWGKWCRSEGAPEIIDAGRVTGGRLAQNLPRREAARVTSERSGVVTRAAIP